MSLHSDADPLHSPWALAATLLSRWLEENARVDTQLDALPRSLSSIDRGRCQSLLFGAVRHLGRIEAHLARLVSQPPRAKLQAVLIIAGYELIEGGDEHHAARVVHHAVEQAKKLTSVAESRLVNAVVRKLALAIAAEKAPPANAKAAQLAVWFSHPEWMVDRWMIQFGPEATRQLLEWNQTVSSVHARWRRRDQAADDAAHAWLAPTPWPNFYEVKSGHWAEVEKALISGDVYLQDPSTRLAVELLAPQPGEVVLDACAAPGGKSLMIADTMGSGRLVAMDLPGLRIDRLKQNLARITGVETSLVQADVSRSAVRMLKEQDLPTEYSAVLIDVPCSNTGVMRHRVDVKWRLRVTDFTTHATQQLALLQAGARLVAPGGRLVYSTCSLDTEENENVVKAFLQQAGNDFELAASVQSRPWVTGHEGAGAFLLRRKKS